MPLTLFKTLQKSAEHMAYGSMLYDWSLGGEAPDRLIVRPVDPWPGNPEAGRFLCEGAFVIDEDQLSLRGECWEPVGVDIVWLEHMHSFTWLRDLRALGGQDARAQARGMIASWIWHYGRWHRQFWAPHISGQRLVMWIALYEFFASGRDHEFHEMFMESIMRQAKHLSRCLKAEDLHGAGLLRAAQGLLYAGLTLEGHEEWIGQALSLLIRELDRQILPDGAHISRSPVILMESLQTVLDVRAALQAAAHPLPEKIQHAIDRMAPALRFFRYSDKRFGLFNGAQLGCADYIDAVLGQSGSRSKAPQSLPHTGYERMSVGRSMVLLDCGKPPPWQHDQHAHAAPLGFEMTYGKERIFVSCGSHHTQQDWREALRATAAHSTLTVANRNACEIREDGHFVRKVKNLIVTREDTKEACLIEASHDGYLPLNGLVHRRRLFLTDQGNDLRGEDSLISTVNIGQEYDFAIRFHVHPRVLVSPTQSGEEVLLRLQSGIGWRFHQSGGVLSVEDSIYLGEGCRPRKTKQIVIHGRVREQEQTIRWAFQREGL